MKCTLGLCYLGAVENAGLFLFGGDIAVENLDNATDAGNQNSRGLWSVSQPRPPDVRNPEPASERGNASAAILESW